MGCRNVPRIAFSGGFVYLSKHDGNGFSCLHPETGTFTGRTIPTPGSCSEGVAFSDGYVDFSEFSDNNIGRLDAGLGRSTEWTIPTPNSQVYNIAVSDDLVYFTEYLGKIGRLDPANGMLTEWTSCRMFFLGSVRWCRFRGLAPPPHVFGCTTVVASQRLLVSSCRQGIHSSHRRARCCELHLLAHFGTHICPVCDHTPDLKMRNLLLMCLIFGVIFAHGGIPESLALSTVSTITLPGGEIGLASGVIAPNDQYAYFGTETTPGRIVRIRLSDFARVDALQLNSGEDNPVSAVVAPDGQYAYFATDTWPARVVKIRLSDLTRVTGLTLTDAEAYLQSGVIDAGGQYAYFAGQAASAFVVRIRLSDLAMTGKVTLTLASGHSIINQPAAVIDPGGQFAYFGGRSSPQGSYIVKIRLSDLAVVATSTYSDVDFSTAVMDPGAQFAYFATNSDPGGIAKIRLSDLSRVSGISLPSEEAYVLSAVIDPGGLFAYFGTAGVGASPGRVVQVRLSDLARVTGIYAGYTSLRCAVVDHRGRYAYFGTWHDPGRVVKVDLGAPFYSVVRGSSNGIYYGATWWSWTALPGGTIDSPAAAVYAGVLHVAVRGDGNRIYYGYVTLSSGVFSGWTQLSGSTPSPPSLTAGPDGNLYLALRGNDNGIYLKVRTGGSWSLTWIKLPGSTIDGPSIAAAGMLLHLTVRGSDGSSIWHGRMLRGGLVWVGWTRVVGTTPSRPALYVASENEVYMVVRGSDNRVYVNKWTGSAWTGWDRIPTGSTLNGPSLAVKDGQLHVAVRGTNGGIYYCTRSLSVTPPAWSSWKQMPGSTPSSPALA